MLLLKDMAKKCRSDDPTKWMKTDLFQQFVFAVISLVAVFHTIFVAFRSSSFGYFIITLFFFLHVLISMLLRLISSFLPALTFRYFPGLEDGFITKLKNRIGESYLRQEEKDIGNILMMLLFVSRV